MPESELHKRARNVLCPGDLVGQPIGDPSQIAKIEPSATYTGDDNTKTLRADLVIKTTDGQTVHIEFDVTNPVTVDKLERLRQASVHRVLSIKLLPECRDYSDDQLREYIALGNVFLKGEDQPQTHKWLYLENAAIFELDRASSGPSEWLLEWEKDTDELARHGCFVANCDKPVMSASESELQEDDAAGPTEMRPRYPRFTPMLPIYACMDHAFQASFSHHPAGSREACKELREHLAKQELESGESEP